MSTDITPYAAEPLSERIEYAKVLARASLIPKALWTPNRHDEQGRLVPSEPSVGNVLLVMEHGAMLDLHPMAAINGIFIIEGKASMSANLMSAVVRGKGYTLRVVTEGEWGPTFKAVATLIRPDDPEFTYRVEWTEAKAKRAELTGKDNWKKYPESMAKARAISEVIREGATDALNGIGYTPEELGASVTESGDVIDGEVVEDAPVAATATATPPARKRATNGRQGTKRAAATPEPAEAPSEPQGPVDDPNIIDAEEVDDEPANDGPAEVLRNGTESDPDKIDRGDEAAVREYNETHGKDAGRYITSDAEREANAARLATDEDAERKAATAALVAQAKIDGAATKAKREADEAEAAERLERERIAGEQEAALREREAIEHADPQTGEVPDEGAETAERIKAERAARGARTTKPKAEAQDEVKAEPEPWAPIDAYEVITANEPEEWEKRLDAATTVPQVKQVWDEASLVEGAMTTALRMSIVKHKARVIAADEQQG
jgi:hypothetical protein